ncbi:hypothetical protein PPERSA_03290 [Pseudocohnilembus persalinus]|uniref:Uncharacterized protein n=1 Tax=Pseudocohnilembus persalinus TaxID=266149 RepID=A0A0V0Q8H7_PSEPJ|nr:hypothetical protein PPERSA_03290 [Pseudocohnilembus persalinus]|eukprot:KRW98459.1 hypothetical protein PPERSA_03290 [Pseudocohnilembus persalinus]
MEQNSQASTLPHSKYTSFHKSQKKEEQNQNMGQLYLINPSENKSKNIEKQLEIQEQNNNQEIKINNFYSAERKNSNISEQNNQIIKQNKKTRMELIKLSFLNNKIILNQIQNIQGAKSSKNSPKKSLLSRKPSQQMSKLNLDAKIDTNSEENNIQSNEFNFRPQHNNLFPNQNRKISQFKSPKSDMNKNNSNLNITFQQDNNGSQSVHQKSKFNAEQERRLLSKRLTFLHKLRIDKQYDDDCYHPIITDQQRIQIIETCKQNMQFPARLHDTRIVSKMCIPLIFSFRQKQKSSLKVKNQQNVIKTFFEKPRQDIQQIQ